MPAERYFVDQPLPIGGSVSLTGSELHHMMHVVRMQQGEQVELINGRGDLSQAHIASLQKKEAWLSILDSHHSPKPAAEIILAQALPRLNRLDLIIEKATELGATQLWLFPGDLSERKSLTQHQHERFLAIMVSALKQSGRLWLPTFEIKPPIHSWTPLPYRCAFGDLNLKAPPLSSPIQLIAIGPESGFSAKEEEKLLSLNFSGIKLSDGTLRTETAAILAVGLLKHCSL